MQKLLYVGIGGFVGAVLRYIISLKAIKVFGAHFPYGTLIVNVIGALLIGFILELSFTTNLISPNLRVFLTVGVLGGLTTFSAFSYETVSLLNNGNYFFFSVNIFLNITLSILGVILGKYATQLM